MAIHALAISSLVFVGCLNNNDEDDDIGTNESSSSILGMSSEDEVMSSSSEELGDIVDIASGDDRFETLTAALTAAGLVETLQGEGPFTVFAPTDDAFDALPAGTLDTLLADPMGQLKDILLYHVVSGSVDASAVVGLDMATTVGGSDVKIEVINGEVILNGTVKVIITDIMASNGIIHVIDAVLIPEIPMSSSEAMSSSSEELGDIVDIASGDDRFETLTAALTAAGLVETLQGEGPFTVFAPTDDAFDALPAGTLDTLLTDPMGQLKDILLYHVVSGSVDASAVVGLDMATTVGGSDVKIEVINGEVILNGTVKVIITDIMASNGIIHVIDAVLIPEIPMSSSEAMSSSSEELGDIVDIASGDDRFETLTAALTAAGLVETLQGEGPFTVFAPTDDAFDALPAGTLDTLLADPMGQLKDILLYHVVSGSVDASAVVGLDMATTVGGSDVKIEVINGEVILNGTVKVIITDIMASNGIIHVIDAVLIPEIPMSSSEAMSSSSEELGDIVDIASGDDRFETLTAALTAAGLVETLQGEGPFTVFAPTDDAFDALPAGTLDTLLADPMGQLKDILLYHVVSGSVDASAVVGLDMATTVGGSDVKIEVINGEVILNGTVKVIITDIMASNGIIHVIDGVLIP